MINYQGNNSINLDEIKLDVQKNSTPNINIDKPSIVRATPKSIVRIEPIEFNSTLYSGDRFDINHVELLLQNRNVYKLLHTRDFYRGKSFNYRGTWESNVYYISDDYNVDFVLKDNSLLACKRSHLSTTLEITDNITNPDYWDVIVYNIDHDRADYDHTRAENDHNQAISDHEIVQGMNDRVTLMQSYTDWYDEYIWSDDLIWPKEKSSGGEDVNVLELLNSAPTLTVRGKIEGGDKRFIVYHPLMNREGAEIVLMRYAKRNGKKTDGTCGTNPKKGYCIASGAFAQDYFKFDPETDYNDLSDFLDDHIENYTRHFGVALRIPNPEWTRDSTQLKNAIYKGIPESLWSDVLPISIRYQNNKYGIGLI